MCAAQHGGEWGLFSIPPAIYLTLGWLQVGERRKAPGSDVYDGRKAGLPAGRLKQPFCGSISHTLMETVYLVRL